MDTLLIITVIAVSIGVLMVIAGFTYFMFIVIYSIIYGFFGSNENVKEGSREETKEEIKEGRKEEEFIEDISDLTFLGENFFPRLYKYDIPAVDKRKFDD